MNDNIHHLFSFTKRFALFFCLIVLPYFARSTIPTPTSEWPIRFHVGYEFALPFWTPENDPAINLLFLMAKQRAMPELYRQDHLMTLADLKHAELGSQSILFKEYPGQFRLESIFDRYPVIKAYQQYETNLTPQLKEYGIDFFKRSAKDLLSLLHFNQQVLADKQLDDAQKALLIDIRAAIFSRSYQSGITDTITESRSNQNDTKRVQIQSLPDIGHIAEYKQYLMYVEEITEYSGYLPQVPTSLTVPWLRESSNFLQLEALNFYEMLYVGRMSAMKMSEEAHKSYLEEINTLGKNYDQLVEQFLIEFPQSQYLIDIYQHQYMLHLDTDKLNRIFEPLVNLPTFETLNGLNKFDQKLIDIYELVGSFRYQNREDGKEESTIAPHYAFLSALSNMHGYDSNIRYYIDNSTEEVTSKVEAELKPKLLVELQNIIDGLKRAKRADLAEFLEITRSWFIEQDADNTIQRIQGLNLQLENARQPDQFAYWMMLSDAYKAKNELEQAKSILLRLQEFDDLTRLLVITKALDPKISRLLPTQKVYIQMRLNELAVMVEN